MWRILVTLGSHWDLALRNLLLLLDLWHMRWHTRIYRRLLTTTLLLDLWLEILVLRSHAWLLAGVWSDILSLLRSIVWCLLLLIRLLRRGIWSRGVRSIWTSTIHLLLVCRLHSCLY